MLMRKLVKLLTKITMVKPGDTVMLAINDLHSIADILRIENALKLKEWSAKTGIHYVLMPAEFHVDVLRKEESV